jgi:hypothetical protein
LEEKGQANENRDLAKRGFWADHDNKRSETNAMAPKIGESEGRFWDLLLKAFGGIIALGTVWAGMMTLYRQGDQLHIQQEQLKLQQDQIASQQSEQSTAREEEYHRRFWEKKLEIYAGMCQAAGKLAFGAYGKDDPTAYKDLFTIYFGEGQLVASPDVSSAVKAFILGLSAEGTDRAAELQSDAQKLALACRQDMGTEFHLTEQEEKRKSDEEFKALREWGRRSGGSNE